MLIFVAVDTTYHFYKVSTLVSIDIIAEKV